MATVLLPGTYKLMIINVHHCLMTMTATGANNYSTVYYRHKKTQTDHQIHTVKLCPNQQDVPCYKQNHYLFHVPMNTTWEQHS